MKKVAGIFKSVDAPQIITWAENQAPDEWKAPEDMKDEIEYWDLMRAIKILNDAGYDAVFLSPTVDPLGA